MLAHRPGYRGQGIAGDEVADTPAFSVVRDTQNREMGALTYGPAEWRAFLDTAMSELG